MARLITHTNILVDDFNFAKSFPKGTFIHFLTHFHADHYEGLSPRWDYGPIYCTETTKAFILHKFPHITNVNACSLRTRGTLEIRPGLFVDFWMLDAKHIPGSAMLLFRGYMGTILFTGDFRYNFEMVTENPVLFPLSKRDGLNKRELVEQMGAIAIPVDEMIFDNTYCNSHFRFGTEREILGLMLRIIEKNRNKQLVYIAMGALGKHRILLEIGRHFQTSIVVSQKQMEKIQVAGLCTDFLTCDPQQGFIHLISKKNRAAIVKATREGPIGNDFICIDTDFLMLEHEAPDGINFIVPYSLHSNYLEMETFVRMVSPCILRKLVVPYANFRHVRLRMQIDHRIKFAKYLDFLQGSLHKSESGYSHLVRSYTEVYKLSDDFLKWFDPTVQARLRDRLRVGQQNHALRKRPILLKD